MSDKYSKAIVDRVNKELGNTAKFFTIKESEILTDESGYFSMTVSIEPKKETNVEDGKVVGTEQYLQIDMDNLGRMSLIIGEDYEQDITYGSIYAALYWGEATEPV